MGTPEQPPLAHATAMDLMALSYLAYFPGVVKGAFVQEERLQTFIERGVPEADRGTEAGMKQSIDRATKVFGDDREARSMTLLAFVESMIEPLLQMFYHFLGYVLLLFEYIPRRPERAVARLVARYPDLAIEHFFSRPLAFMAVSREQKRVFVVFRGTVRIIDWLYNLATPLVHLDARFNHAAQQGVFVHKGFQEQLLSRLRPVEGAEVSLYDALLERMRPYLKENYTVHVTGHSLGGALSLLFSFYLSQDRTVNVAAPEAAPAVQAAQEVADAPFFGPANPITAVTFATPRSGNSIFKRIFEATDGVDLYRVCHRGDLIPAVPSFDFFRMQPYCHVTKTFTYSIFSPSIFHGLIPLSEKGFVNIVPRWTTDALGFNWVSNCYEFSFVFANSLVAHAFAIYYDVLEKAEEDWVE